MPRVLIAGCGYVGTILALRLSQGGYEAWGLRRCAGNLPAEIRPLSADLSSADTLKNLPPGLDYVFYTASPESSSEEAYRACYETGLANLMSSLKEAGQRPRRLFLTSSTGVYSQSSGEWVDETSPAEPTHFSGRLILEGERLLQSGPFEATVLRAGGIYGPGRTRLIEQVREGKARCTSGPPIYTNRIQVEDCAGALAHLMDDSRPAGVYIGVDCEPSDRCIVLRWMAGQLNAPPPRLEDERDLDSRRFRSNKRCSNAKLLSAGYVFRYPSFREGYRTVMAGLTTS
ncbi:MAG: NAD-dependent epimerase/dehydratase family protein [Acidobacteriota bacterium]